MRKFILTFLIICSLGLLCNTDMIYADESRPVLQLDGKKISGVLTNEELSDSYIVEIEKPGCLEIYVNDRDCCIGVYSDNLEKKYWSYVYEANYPVKWYLIPGTYYIEVFGSSCEVLNYTISAKFKEANDISFEPNNSFKQASQISIDKVIKGQNALKDVDIYTFEVSKTTRVKMDYTSYGHCANIILFNEKKESILDFWTEDTKSDEEKKNTMYYEFSPGRYYLQIVGNDEFGCGNYEFQLSEEIDIKKCSVKVASSVAGTGKEVKPSVTVTYEGKKLVEGVDYTVKYKNNINFGKATVEITGLGKYKGTVKKTFNIVVETGRYGYIDEYKYQFIGTYEVALVGLRDKSVSRVRVPEEVEIGGNCFFVTQIGEKAFYKNTTIKEVTISQEVRKIGTQAFYGCANLTKVKLDASEYEDGIIICKNAFGKCDKLKTVNGLQEGCTVYSGKLRYTLKKDGTYRVDALEDKKATSVAIPSTVKIGAVSKKVTSVRLKAFSGTSMKSLVIGKYVTEIGSNAFKSCKSLAEITFNGSKIKIDGTSFDGCTKLKTIKAEKGTVYTIGNYKYKVTTSSEVAFAGLSKSVTSVSIAKTIKLGAKSYKITSIGDKALTGQSVKSVTIGENVKKIGKQAFKDCTKLATITIKSKGLTSVGSQAFTKIKSNAVIKVPSTKLKEYKKLFNDKGLPSKVTIKAL